MDCSGVGCEPLCETIHFVGLSLVIGIVGFFDLRLMGFLKRVPLRAARDLMPLAIAGAKVFFLVLAGLNALVFETTVGASTIDLGAGDDTPATAKIIGAVSLVSWLAVVYWGRMLPFIGNAF